MSRWMRQIFTRPVRRPLVKNRLRRHHDHHLEDRCVPATVITVTSTGDSTDTTNLGNLTLRAALLLANSEIAPYDGQDTIDLSGLGSKATPATITLNLPAAPLGAGGALLAGAGGVVLLGPTDGPSALTIKQTVANSRVINVSDGDAAGASTYSFSNLTFTGGSVTSTLVADRGAGIGIDSENVTINNCVITANSTAGVGGGIAVYTLTPLTVLNINNSTISFNKSGGNSGGLRTTTGNTLNVTNSLITGNTSGSVGGGFYTYRGGPTTLTNTTISFNSAAGTIGGGGAASIDPDSITYDRCVVINNRATDLIADGGGIMFRSSSSTTFHGPITIVNTTVANNSANEYGGGVFFNVNFGGSASILFSTITNNTAGLNGGGISRSGILSNRASITLDSSVVTGNQATTHSDILLSSSTSVTVNNSAVGVREGFLINSGTGLILGNSAIQLGVVSGANPAAIPAPTSPLRNAASTTGVPATDQRGNPRVPGSADIGAIETTGNEVVARLVNPLTGVDAPGGSSYSVTVTYFSSTLVKLSSIDASDLVVSGPASASVAVGSVSSVVDAPSITVTYVVTPPGGTWDTADNGDYTISLAPNAVENTAGTSKTESAMLGTVSVAVGSIFTVTNLNASGAGSFAQAVLDAQAGTPGLTDLIRFDPALFSGGAQTISLSGPITITDTVNIQGPGRDLLTVRQSVADRIFNINDGSDTGKFSSVFISGMTLRDGSAAGRGGAIKLTTEYLTLNDVRIVGNTAAGHGGAIAADVPTGSGGNQASRVLVFNSEIDGNRNNGTNFDGGAIWVGNTTFNRVWIANSQISNNIAGRAGGGIAGTNYTLQVENSLITGNVANGSLANYGGGAIHVFAGTRSVEIRNSTISGNRNDAKTSGGGAINLNPTAGQIVYIVNSTIANNTAAGPGGGIHRTTSANGELILINSIVDGNKAGTIGPDINGDVLALNSLISQTGPNAPTDLGGSKFDVSANLTPLYNFGGPLRAHGTLPDITLATPSPARDSGILTGLPNDQRGPGFNRVNGTTDMGSLEFALSAPLATSSTFGTVSTPLPNYQFTISFYDDTAINLATLNGDEIIVTGPGGFSQLATIVGVPTGTPNKYDVVYNVNAPGGFWSVAANGDYTVTLKANSAFDTGGLSVPQTTFGAFTIFVPPQLKVTNTNDSGPGSLRAVMADANKVAGAATVTFDPTVFATPQTITLTSFEIPVSNNITVVGPGAANVSIGNPTGRVFNIENATDTITFTVSGVTFANSRSFGASAGARGGAIVSNGENLVFNSVNFINNAADSDGGAISITGGSLTWTNGSAIGNRSTSAIGDGGFLFATGAPTITITGSTMSGNYAVDGGGALYISGGTTTLESSTISGNSAGPAGTSYGGGIYLLGAVNFNATNATISGNVASKGGGGIRFTNSTIVLTNTTIANNTAQAIGGGGIFRSAAGVSGGVTINGSVIGNNVAPPGAGNDIFDATTVGLFLSDNSAISDSVGFNLAGTLAVPFGTPLLLGPLTNNGGPTATHLPAAGSPLRNAVSFPAYLEPTVDQRGIARPVGSATDIGAVESAGTEPVGIPGAFADVNTAGGTSYAINVTYYDDGTISGIDNNDIRVTGPGGFNVLATVVSQTPVPGGVAAVYQFTPSGGSFSAANAGVYTISLEAGQVTDGTTPVAAATLGQFRVNLARSFVVTNTKDSGAGSLRQAVLDANAITGVDTISFDPTVFGSAQTITLTSGDIVALEGVTINGPGAKLLTVSTSGRSRHFQMFNADGAVTPAFTVNDMTLANGKLLGVDADFDVGGSILIARAELTVNRVAFLNNSTVNNGGVYNHNGASTATFNNVLFAGNVASSGGAIRFPSTGGLLTINNSTFSGNTANTNGGAVSIIAGTMNINNSTIVNNVAVSGGGNGGGLAIGSSSTTAVPTLFSTLVANNTTGGTGPDIRSFVGSDVTADFSLVRNLAGATVFSTNGTLLTGIDPLINPLADNGGPTQTHSLKAGSPLIDAGSNSIPLTFDQRGASFNRTVDDPLVANAPFGDGTDIGAFEVQPATGAKVTGVVINNGAAQRSRVTSLKVSFDQTVTFADITKAFTLNRVSDSASVTLNTVLDGSGTFVTITFTGGAVDGANPVRSLADGRYTLVAVAGEFAGGGLDGNGDGTAGDNFVFGSTPFVNVNTPATGIFRLFGDNNGNGQIGTDDFLAFRLNFLSNNDAFDNDGNGSVDASDFLKFRLNFLATIV